MARIRTIKPEFPQSETVGKLSRDARLLFILLWTIVDDEGRARAASRMLASLLYPYDDDARDLIEAWLDELEREQCVRRYAIEGASYLVILNWLKHQKIDKPSKSRLPPPPDNSRSLANVREASGTDLVSGPVPRTKKEGGVVGGGEPEPAPAKPAVENSPAADLAMTVLLAGKLFEDFWNEWKGQGSKEAARRTFLAAIRDGVHPDAIILGMRRQGNGANVQSAEDWIVSRKWDVPKALISAEAHDLASEITVIAGHDAKFAPPAWMGAALRVQGWLDQGWHREVILLSARKIMAGKRDGPPHSIKFFETGIAREIAQMSAPLPEIIGIPAKQVEANREANQRHPATGFGAAKDAGRAAHARLRESIAETERALAGSGEGGGQVVELLPAAGRA